MKILLADRDTEVLEVTTYALHRYGFDVTAVRDGVDALRCWKETCPDLVLAELDLPRMTGLELCREIRRHSDTPVILASTRNADDEALLGFELGADDYVKKPFSHRQLGMRIRGILSRKLGTAAMARDAELRAGNLRLNLESHEVTCANRTVRLTPIEFRIFYQLVLNAGRVVTTARLIDYAWGYNGTDGAALKMHVSRIRQKLALHGPHSEHIVSVRWVGYVLNDAELYRATRVQPSLALH